MYIKIYIEGERERGGERRRKRKKVQRSMCYNYLLYTVQVPKFVGNQGKQKGLT